MEEAAMTSHHGRLYTLALGLVVFFLAWAVVAARPWGAPAAVDPRHQGLIAREQRLRHEAVLVNRIVTRRWAVYHKALRARNAEIAAAKARAAQQAQQAQQAASYSAAAAPSVRVVNLPPITITRTS
jgi:multidrug efflux pump subunit AcrA (membrane-fusion protein)